VLFKFKKKKIVLDCFTYRPEVYRVQPLQKANRFYPDWWAKLPSYKDLNMPFSGMGNMRGCVGFTQLYSKGFIMPMWCDAGFTVGSRGEDNFSVDFADGKTQIVQHSQEQRGGYLDAKDYQHLKIESPWQFKCNRDIKWMWQQPVWNFDKPEEVLIPPAIVDYLYNTTSSINMILPRSTEPKEIFIELGAPLVHIIPLIEGNVEIKNHLISQEEYNNIYSANNAPVSFKNSYVKKKKILSKCPMGH
tara:strand:- start:25 stop:762 length:738 start_codon:yes stop_codon:yes gene_type:complete